MTEHQLDVHEPGQLEVGGETGRARHLLAALEAARALADHTHRPIMAPTSLPPFRGEGWGEGR